MNTIIETNKGKIEGYGKDGIIKWLGVPYAKPPVGELRFKRAQPCEQWSEVLPCKIFSKRPIQFAVSPIEEKAIVEESEDCLYLNIWSKDDKKTNKPVFIWIYGGAYITGESNLPLYDGRSYANEDIIFVSFNYRLGPLGSMDFSIIDDERFDSNCTLSDQIQALKWVKENIANFGGNPENITICGESAGGASVCSLMASPATKGLYNKVICESGLPDIENSRNMSKLRIESLKYELEKNSVEIKDLEKIDINILKNAFIISNKKIMDDYPGIQAIAYVLDDLLPLSPIEAIKNGYAKDVSLIIGTNKDEGTIFLPMKFFPDQWEPVKKMFDINNIKEDFYVFKEYYSEKGTLNQQLAELAKDRQFLVGSIRFADAQSRYNKVWRFRFDFEPESSKMTGLGSMHTCEIPFALGTVESARFLIGTSSERIEPLRKKMMNAWINFVKNGDPNDESSSEWNNYDESDLEMMVFNDESKMMKDIQHDKLLDVWKNINIYKEHF